MKCENYSYTSEESSGNMTYYEEQLLLNYDDYLDSTFEARLKASNHYNLKPGSLKEDFYSEYDENNLEEVESIYLQGEYDKNEEKPGAFLIL